MDLLGSAHALLGRYPGFAAILGTGTNSCIYDGERVVKNIDSLGFILGDEGSGAYLGKTLICDYIRGNMPSDVYELVKNQIKMNGDELINEIYTKPFPNRFCAQYAIFIEKNLKEENYFYQLVQHSFRALFKNIISHYEHYNTYKFNCVGSIGYHFQSILAKVANEYDMEMGKIIKFPLEGLVAFYKNSK
jgi:N-acetylglucosamine kinase-like BadF-type ATPase